ncbi:pyridoxamine 5'-phosphate oxidase family protein [Pelobacter propionicus]|uniref:Pyridoxamine 5'-phosphate oxidase-related, FMN-binding protein n=1 Tax=Pelobacter propionicus (strain DSM 2379 / NBRC 103807 / OttBd1) TaxID=338966 RepID=A1ALI5_PELPD|nr:pyridoxamine 5'-phosphate oxidase family protein [Pelobacter propionicus]ABK98205.1 pyridoxamine 5'-phosphate oxidase-related, FMN-binding protein [Pelobacter propionicus DSM 2379]
MARGSNGNIRQEIINYMEQTQWAELATVREDGTPVIRTMGAFAIDGGGARICFATMPGAAKTRHISSNNRVSFFFQHEGQDFPTFRNVEALGDASRITKEEDLRRTAERISARSPFVKDLIEKNGLGVFEFYEIRVSEIKFLNFSKGVGPQAVEVIKQ